MGRGLLDPDEPLVDAADDVPASAAMGEGASFLFAGAASSPKTTPQNVEPIRTVPEQAETVSERRMRFRIANMIDSSEGAEMELLRYLPQSASTGRKDGVKSAVVKYNPIYLHCEG